MVSQNSSAASGGGSGSSTRHPPNPEAVLQNEALSKYLLVVCGSVATALLIWRLSTKLVRHVRTVACLNNDTQRYFAIPSAKLSFFKKHILYSPVLRKRHNREFQLSSAINVGTLPTRLELAFLVGYFATNVAFCMLNISFSGPYATVARQIRDRTGTLSVVNLVRSLFASIFARLPGAPPANILLLVLTRSHFS
jgi:hypothetical protein